MRTNRLTLSILVVLLGACQQPGVHDTALGDEATAKDTVAAASATPADAASTADAGASGAAIWSSRNRGPRRRMPSPVCASPPRRQAPWPKRKVAHAPSDASAMTAPL